MKNLSFASACVIQQYSSATSFKKNLYYRILFIVVHIYFCIFLERVFQNNNFSIFAAFFVILDVVVVVAVMVLRHWTYVLVLLLDKSINRLLFGKIMFLVVEVEPRFYKSRSLQYPSNEIFHLINEHHFNTELA